MATSSKKPNVVLIISDQQRSDTIPGAGQNPIRTPHLEWLLESSICFDRAYCTTPMCSPARSSILTGLYPHATGMVANYQERPISNEIRLFPGVKVLADYLQPLDYICAYTGKWHLGTGGDRRGFTDLVTRAGIHDYDVGHPEQNDMLRFAGKIGVGLGGKLKGNDVDKSDYDQRTKVGSSLLPMAFHRSMRDAVQAATFIRDQTTEERPFALVYSCYEPHPPFACPRPFDSMYDPDDMVLPATRRSRTGADVLHDRNDWQLQSADEFSDTDLQGMWAGYCGAVSYVDHLVGTILEALIDTDQLDDTLLIFTSDHGEMLGSHGLLFKGSVLFEELVNIPLIVRPPGGLADDRRTQELVSHVDLVPTIVGWCAGSAPGEIQGKDIRDLCEGGDSPVRDGLALEFHSSNWGETPNPLRGWRTADWKYIATIDGGDELYDLTADPLETHNLIDDSAADIDRRRLGAELEEWLASVPDSWPVVPRPER